MLGMGTVSPTPGDSQSVSNPLGLYAPPWEEPTQMRVTLQTLASITVQQG